MTLIVCLDNGHGMLFNHRRQSRDARVCERILEITAGNKLIMNAYSSKLFSGSACVVAEEIFCADERDAFVFAESEVPIAFLRCVDRLIIYRWNRYYPSDVQFPFKTVIQMFHKESSCEFAGNSHEVITEEVYVR